MPGAIGSFFGKVEPSSISMQGEDSGNREADLCPLGNCWQTHER